LRVSRPALRAGRLDVNLAARKKHTPEQVVTSGICRCWCPSGCEVRKTPLANVTEAHITRNYRWWTAFGVRGSMVDDGLSFGTNHNAGVGIHFAEASALLKLAGRITLRVRAVMLIVGRDWLVRGVRGG
jgi:hypothetical protein